jgi:acyl-coenzyme A thioesterase PaaI-like protein
VSFNVEFSRPVSKGELVARGRYLGRSGRHYLAEAVLMDAEGNEIAKGSGAFVESRTRLSKKIGYE